MHVRCLFALASLSACAMPPAPPPPTGMGIGEPCNQNSDCASNLCLNANNAKFCSDACTSDADCMSTGGRSLVCGVDETMTRRCVPPCGALRYTCVGGISTSCSVVNDESHCGDCLCATPGEHCQANVGCFPPAPVGEYCHLPTDCVSHNCSTYADVCRVPVGSPCSAADCDECLHLPDGTTHCARECATPADCGSDMCAGSSALGYYQCRPSQCIGNNSCTVEVGPHQLGQSCRQDSDCASGQCFFAHRCAGGDCIGEGWCTQSCTAESDCDSTTHCVTIPCADEQTLACGNICLHACEDFVSCGVFGGSCNAVLTPTRTLAQVCDVRHVSGSTCVEGRDCVSGVCGATGCSP